eukprot:3128050-Rhodomonas_salina.3
MKATCAASLFMYFVCQWKDRSSAVEGSACERSRNERRISAIDCSAKMSCSARVEWCYHRVDGRWVRPEQIDGADEWWQTFTASRNGLCIENRPKVAEAESTEAQNTATRTTEAAFFLGAMSETVRQVFLDSLADVCKPNEREQGRVRVVDLCVQNEIAQRRQLSQKRCSASPCFCDAGNNNRKGPE